ncbi:YkgJ family cysteine cluster protein [Salinadaptatus halalkaliphilus]|uniref:YkgJ family cysteine cluster protein n=1 Tax=Salinadaptatus halalkaliphilus TaxID=2419781 RepID=A0A4S3TTJ0_9EURY|nr:YkgJ family cysteine cluster protein [Salinadaptatus halalkaliphilus]THE66733.1 YkgJ family cysteine cluster protein [Salinadaptatus halalkaliphilus]
MEVNCAGCAGCCMDWRPLLEASEMVADEDGIDPGDDHEDDSATDHETVGARLEGDRFREPLDDDPNFVPLARDEIRAFLEGGYAAALTPRFWMAGDADAAVEVDGRSIAAIAGRPVFLVGLCKPPKPVAPFGRKEPAWLPTCIFLDPTTLQCRLYEHDLFPAECGAYPEHTLALEAETECERVEATFGGDRLLEADIETDLENLLLGPQAIGEKCFCHPDPDALEGAIDRLVVGESTPEDRAECLAVAAASSTGTLAISDFHYEWGRARALEAVTTDRTDTDTDEDPGSWVGPAIRAWQRRRIRAGGAVPDPELARTIEDARGAPETPGWETIDGERSDDGR